MTLMNDYFGKALNIGDKVVFTNESRLYTGEIVGFTGSYTIEIRYQPSQNHGKERVHKIKRHRGRTINWRDRRAGISVNSLRIIRISNEGIN